MGKSSKKSSHKHKKHRRRHSSSSSSSSNSKQGDDQWEELTSNDTKNEIPTSTVIKGPTMPTQADLEKLEQPKAQAPVTFALEPLNFDSLTNYRRENKQAVKKAQSLAEMEAVMQERELNPNLRGQQSEKTSTRTAVVGDAGLEWHRRAFERCKQQAKDEQRSLNDIVSERYGSMEKLMALIGDAEDLQNKSQSSTKKKFLNPTQRDDHHHHHHHRHHHRNDDRSDHHDHHRHEDRRSDDHHRHHHHHHHHHRSRDEKQSWKRSTDDDREQVEPIKKQARTDEEAPSNEPEPTVQNVQDDKEDDMISEENLIELRKQLIRAELAGDDEMTEMLREEIKRIDQIRGGNSHESSTAESSTNEGANRKVLVMTTVDRYGVEKPVHRAHEPGQQRQYGHVDRRDRRQMKKEMRKMRAKERDPEQHGLTLKDLVEMEKHSTSNMMPVMPGQGSATMSADRHVLASTRHLTGWAKIQALAEQKKRQKAFEQCWLCIENLSKSYIFGLMDHWFLCAPPQQSLVDGHCFLVPIQHSSSRFHLDDDVLAELDSLKQQLTDLFRKYHRSLPVFIETFKNPRLLPHIYIECIPVPIEQANLVPMYFRKALLESESMWATNKKILELKDYHSRTLKSVIPKGLPYFCVEFHIDKQRHEPIHGYAHMIEERGQFPLYFGREILGGLMEIENPLLWMRPASKEPDDVVQKKCTYLKELWKKTNQQSFEDD